MRGVFGAAARAAGSVAGVAKGVASHLGEGAAQARAALTGRADRRSDLPTAASADNCPSWSCLVSA